MATNSTNSSFFMNTQAPGFGACAAADELMHHELNATLTDPALTETQFLGFNVPDAGIHSLNYLWAHPNLRLLTGGVWTWRGVKPNALSSEMFDMRQFMPDDPIRGSGDLNSFELPNGYHVEVGEPLRTIRIGYEDAARGNAFDVELTAIMPPAVLPSGRHFDQAMRTRGSVTLRGESYPVDGWTVRDRSWGENRTEEPRNAPPLHWMTGVFDDDFAFHLMGIEHASAGPVWKDVYPVDDTLTEAMNRGWIWRDGELLALASGAVRTRWDRATGYPTGHELTLVDTRGQRYVITGDIMAINNWSAWSNAFFAIGLTRWQYGDRVGHGDSQTAAWTDFVRALHAG